MEITDFYMNFHLKDDLGIEFTAYEGKMMKGELMSFVVTHIAVLHLMSQIRSRIENLIPSDNIIVLEWHFD